MVLNKIDLSPRLGRGQVRAVFPDAPLAEISARTGEGVERLRKEIHDFVVQSGIGGFGDRTVIMEARHKRALEEAWEAVERARKEAGRSVTSEIVALEIGCALDKLGEIMGETISEDILEKIFSRFCVGK